jgi:uncharacterized protein YecE (DUF72 family)
MEFGKVEHPENIDFTLPKDHPDTKRMLNDHKNDRPFEVYVGCAKWNKKDLKGFYPRGTKDELVYYSSQFNSIELNATFYKAPSISQVQTWRDKVPEGFKFYPKIPREISHYSRLSNISDSLTAFCDAISNFEDTLGIPFLQLHDNFKPKDLDRLQDFIKEFPKGMPLAVEVRNKDWFISSKEGDHLFKLLLKESKIAILVDTAGRRDLLHMRLSSPHAFIRYVGANHPSDYTRLDDWVERIKQWRQEGLQSLHFFVHQNIEKESPLLSAYFIQKMNKEFNLNLKVPAMAI